MNGKSLLGLKELNVSDIYKLLDHARFMKQQPSEKLNSLLAGKTIALLFFEPSTRTRLSFELAARKLGAYVLTFHKEISSLLKGESLIDTVRNIEALGTDLLVIRHPHSGGIYPLVEVLSVPVINAGDGCHEHPTQALLDMFTIREERGIIEDLNVVVAGDILHSRVARSLLWGLKKTSARLVFTGPPTLLPSYFTSLDIKINGNFEEVIQDADVLYLLRLQVERQVRGLIPSLTDYTRNYGLTYDRLRLLKQGAIIMHPGPVNVGVEISRSGLNIKERNEEGLNVLIQQQITNGVFVRMAILDIILRGGDKDEKNSS